MKNLNLIPKPYDDNNMKFDESTQRYELTIQCLKDQFGDGYKDDNVTNRRIKLNSRVVYTYIYYHTATFNRQLVNLLLTRTKEGRQFIFDILKEQQYADLEYSYNDLAYAPAINFNGQDKDRNEIKRNTLCVAAEEIFQNSSQYFGFNIGYLGQFPPHIAFLFSK